MNKTPAQLNLKRGCSAIKGREEPSTVVVIGAALALVPGLPVIKMLVGVQVLNGILLPIILIFILLLINDKRLTAELKNTRRNNVLAIGTLVLITTAVMVMLGSQLLGLFGVRLTGGS